MAQKYETYCPRCGKEGLTPQPGGVNEYDSRQSLLPRHNDPNNSPCIEVTTPRDARRFVKEWVESGRPADIKQIWPYLSEGNK